LLAVERLLVPKLLKHNNILTFCKSQVLGPQQPHFPGRGTSAIVDCKRPSSAVQPKAPVVPSRSGRERQAFSAAWSNRSAIAPTASARPVRLVTAVHRGKGLIVLFHVTADTRWSDLPLSGIFVEMLNASSGAIAAEVVRAPVTSRQEWSLVVRKRSGARGTDRMNFPSDGD
jgi:hypothetical protein